MKKSVKFSLTGIGVLLIIFLPFFLLTHNDYDYLRQDIKIKSSGDTAIITRDFYHNIFKFKMSCYGVSSAIFYSYNGELIGVEFFDENNKRQNYTFLSTSPGFAIAEYKYDNRGRIVSESYFDKEKRIVSQRNIFENKTYSYLRDSVTVNYPFYESLNEKKSGKNIATADFYENELDMLRRLSNFKISFELN